MAEIPYIFDLPPPRYFRDNDWFTNRKMMIFIHWAFSRCSLEKRIVYHVHTSVELEPFEFIFGRTTCSLETGLTENEVRSCIHQLNDTPFGKMLKKTTSKSTNKFTVYKWSIELFYKNNNQQNHQQTTSRPPADHHNQEDKNERSKESHHPYPSSPDSPKVTDDFSFEKKERTAKGKIEIYPGEFISQKTLDDCIAIKGSQESVSYAIGYILRHPSRKSKIRDWPSTLAKWEIKSDIKPKIKENEEMGQRLENEHGNSHGWRCEMHTDRKKELKGILFYNSMSTGNSEPIFIPFVDLEFKEKASKILREKNMQRGKIK